MIQILHHQYDQLVEILSNKGERLFWDDFQEKDIEGLNTHQFICLATVPAAQYLEKRARYLIPSEDGNFYEEYIVMEAVTRMGEKQVFAKASYHDINKQRIVEPQRYQAWTLAQYVEHALMNTEWEVGTVEYVGIRSKTFDSYLGAYDFLNQVKTLFDHDFEMRFRVEVSGNQIVGRYIDLLERIGHDTQKEIVYGKDLTGIEKRVYNERIVTQLIGLGPERQDGTRLQVTVSDDDAFQRWNRNGYHITEVYEPMTEDQDMTLDRLQQLTEMELNKRTDSVVEYTVDAIVLEELYPHERTRLGDRIRVKDPEFSPPLYAEARVIRVRRSIINRFEKSYTIGEVVEYDTQELFKTFTELQSTYGLRVIKSPLPPDGSFQKIWIDTSRIPEVPHTWDGSTWVKFTPTAAPEIGAETPEGASEKAGAALDAAVIVAQDEAAAAEGAAKQHADTVAGTAEQNAKNYADTQDAALRTELQGYVEENAGGSGNTVTQGTTAPSSPKVGDLWIDTNTDPYVWKVWNGSIWDKAIATDLSELEGVLASNQLALDAIKSDHISTGAVLTEALAQGAVTTEKVDGLDAKVISTGVLNAARVAIGSGTSFAANYDPTTKETPQGAQTKAETAAGAALDTATDLIEQNGVELINQSYKADATKRPFNSGSYEVIPPPTDVGLTDTKSNIIRVTNSQMLKSDFIPYTVGQPVYIETTVRNVATTNGTFYVGLEFYDKNKVEVASNAGTIYAITASTAQLPADTWKTFSGTILPAATAAQRNAAFVRLRILTRWSSQTGVTLLSDIKVRQTANTMVAAQQETVELWRYQDTTFIDGGNLYTNSVVTNALAAEAVTAEKLGANSVIASKIASGSISSTMIATVGLDAGVVKFGTMSGDRIAVNSLSADRLKANSIIASNITFTGILDGATGTFSGDVIVGNINSPTGGTEIRGGSLISESYVNVGNSYGDYTRNRVSLLSGSLEFWYRTQNQGVSKSLMTTIYGSEKGILVNQGMELQGYLYLGNTTLGASYFYISPNSNITIANATFDVTSQRKFIFSNGIQVTSGAAIFGGSYVDFNTTEYHYSTQYMYGTQYRYGGQMLTNQSETGYCGIGGMTASIGGTTSPIVGVGVNFRVQKTYTPSSITLNGSSHNLVLSTHVLAIDISTNGFWLYVLNGQSGSNVYRYWRGTYTA